MKNKIFYLLVLLSPLFMPNLLAELDSFPQLMHELLLNNSEYKQLILNNKQELSSSKLRKSLNILDVNASYESLENDMERVEVASETENATIFEADELWQIEISKQFFPKDFDSTEDSVKEKLTIYRLKQEIALSEIELMEEILDDFINWWEAQEKILLLESLSETLTSQKNLLTNLAEDNLVNTKLLIAQLEDLEKCSSDLTRSRKIIDSMQSKYDTDLSEFIISYEQFIAARELPDNSDLAASWNNWTTSTQAEIKPFYTYLNLMKFTPFMPQVDLSLSWNWRNTEQEWEISKQNEFTVMQREQTEEYPEFGLELSIPLDIVRSSSGKLNILQNYQRELQLRERDFTSELNQYSTKRVKKYQSNRNKLELKQELRSLYENQLTMIEQQLQPTSHGISKDLQDARLKSELSQIACDRINFELYKELFLYNFINRENYETD